MALITLRKCDRCGVESRADEIKPDDKAEAVVEGFRLVLIRRHGQFGNEEEKEICPSCMALLSKFFSEPSLIAGVEA